MRRRMCFVFAAGLLLAMLVAPAATAAGGTRPFEARMAGQVHWDETSHCDYGVTTITEPTGQALHMGAIVARWMHCPEEPNNTEDGVLEIIAANGDELHGMYDYMMSDINEIEIEFEGGTGRFADAIGHATATYDIVPVFIEGCNPDPDPFVCLDFSVPWDWWATLSGTISY